MKPQALLLPAVPPLLDVQSAVWLVTVLPLVLPALKATLILPSSGVTPRTVGALGAAPGTVTLLVPEAALLPESLLCVVTLQV